MLRGSLQEAHRRLRERERLLEEVEGVVIVEDLDRLGHRGDLLRAHRLALGPLLLPVMFLTFFLTFGEFLANFERLVLGCIETNLCK